jgi:hypothetical protein
MSAVPFSFKPFTPSQTVTAAPFVPQNVAPKIDTVLAN